MGSARPRRCRWPAFCAPLLPQLELGEGGQSSASAQAADSAGLEFGRRLRVTHRSDLLERAIGRPMLLRGVGLCTPSVALMLVRDMSTNIDVDNGLPDPDDGLPDGEAVELDLEGGQRVLGPAPARRRLRRLRRLWHRRHRSGLMCPNPLRRRRAGGRLLTDLLHAQ